MLCFGLFTAGQKGTLSLVKFKVLSGTLRTGHAEYDMGEHV
jgi:hypothetical protein